MSNILYSKNELISSIKKYFLSYFSDLSKPTQENLILLILGMYSMESFNSVRSCYKHLLKKCSNKSINAYYETLSNTKLDPIDFNTFKNSDVEFSLCDFEAQKKYGAEIHKPVRAYKMYRKIIKYFYNVKKNTEGLMI